jgi:hypothetical protein
MAPQNFGIKYIAEAYLPTEYINFADPLAPARPLPKNRRGQSPEEYMIFWAVAAGSVVHLFLGERAAALAEGALA